eukprot:1161247-Pelagomonas_calceolata.AAC.3
MIKAEGVLSRTAHSFLHTKGQTEPDDVWSRTALPLSFKLPLELPLIAVNKTNEDNRFEQAHGPHRCGCVHTHTVATELQGGPPVLHGCAAPGAWAGWVLAAVGSCCEHGAIYAADLGWLYVRAEHCASDLGCTEGLNTVQHTSTQALANACFSQVSNTHKLCLADFGPPVLWYIVAVDSVTGDSVTGYIVAVDSVTADVTGYIVAGDSVTGDALHP